MKPLCIGMVCFGHFGGSGVIASDLAAGLAERGHRVMLFSGSQPVRAPAATSQLSVHALALPTYPALSHPPYDLALATALCESHQARPFDVIHLHYAVPHAISSYIAAQMLGAARPQFVHTLHGTDVTGFGKDAAYAQALRFLLAQADGVTTPSTYLQQQAYNVLHLPQAVEVIANFVDTASFAPAPRDPAVFQAMFGAEAPGPVLFHVSNFRPVKRVTDIIDALAIVRRNVPAKLLFVGDGPELANARDRVRVSGLEHCVRFLGPRADFVTLLQQADVFVMPSDEESFGLAALEALSCGVPVVACAVGGLPEVVTPETGSLVAPRDVPALASAILRVLGGSGRDAFAVNARAHVLRNFQRGPAVARYEEYYRRHVAMRTTRGI